jgi:hypothetical protein
MHPGQKASQNALYGVGAASALSLSIVTATLVKLWSGLFSICASMMRAFQNVDRASAFLAFAMIWIATAAIALASAYLVFRVAETRKHHLGR